MQNNKANLDFKTQQAKNLIIKQQQNYQQFLKGCISQQNQSSDQQLEKVLNRDNCNFRKSRQTCVNAFRPSYMDKNKKNRVIILDFDEATKQLQQQANMKKRDKLRQKFEKRRSKTNMDLLYIDRRFQHGRVSNISEQEFEADFTNLKSISVIEQKQQENYNNNQEQQKLENNEKEQNEQNQQKTVTYLSKQLNDLINNFQKKQKASKYQQISTNKSTKQVLLQEFKVPTITDKQNMEVLIGSCYMVVGKNPSPVKIKYQINLSSIILRNQIMIEYQLIQKIKTFCGDNQTIVLKLTLCDKYNLPNIDKTKSIKTNTIYLLEHYEIIYTIFSSIVFRKALVTPSLNISNQCSESKEQNKNISQLFDDTTLAVTSYFLGRSEKQFQENQLLKHIIGDDNVIGQDVKMQGMIFKKSRHLKKWSKRYIRIQQHEISSFHPQTVQLYNQEQQKITKRKKKLKSIKPTFQTKAIDELWTRFEPLKIKNSKYLIIKTHHFDVEKCKTEFGIPLMNYANILQKQNWLYGFYSLLRKQK